MQDFINKNLNAEISKLLFKGSPFTDITIQELVEQIEAKKRCRFKLFSWFDTSNIYYPNKLHIEQCSSEVTATYKASLISGNSLIDLTGGFGVDAYFFSKRFKKVALCEINTSLTEAVVYNYQLLGVNNIKTVAGDGLIYLQTQNKQYDWIYIDPSRRSNTKEKVFLLKDCVPNVPENLQSIFKYTSNILIKVSPMLDISSAIKELIFVKAVYVVSIENEVKELLFLLEKHFDGTISIKTSNITSKSEENFESEYKSQTKAEFSLPKTYLYEPNAAILKAGFFNEVSDQLKVYKLHVNSHLYTSDILCEFPGRQFIIKHSAPYDKKNLERLVPAKKANITTRNFPETVAQIRKKTGLKEGGNVYLFFTTDLNNKRVVLICEKV